MTDDLDGPSISCEPLGSPETSADGRRLTADQRQRLARIASPVSFKRGQLLYRQGEPATVVYNIVHGVVSVFRMLPSGRRRVLAFIFAEDLVGLAARGRYVNTARAVTSVSAYRLPLRALDALLRKDASLQYPFFCKVSEELREAQHLAIVLARRDAAGKVASFLHLLEREPTATRAGHGRIFIPMSRTDIADHLGLTLESVSRAFAELERRRIVHFPDARHVKVLDRARFRQIVCAT
jgi:CRP-like cAMP-binding protein